MSDLENWKAIPGYEGFYEASDLGRIRSVARTFIQRSGKVRSFPSVVLRQKFKGNKYLCVCLCISGKERSHSVHRLVLMAFEGVPEGDLHGRHLDGDASNCRLSNLSWGTPKQNAEDKFRHGTNLSGEAHHQAKLTADQVAEIRTSVGPSKEIARRYGIASSTVRAIRVRRLWKEVA